MHFLFFWIKKKNKKLYWQKKNDNFKNNRVSKKFYEESSMIALF